MFKSILLSLVVASTNAFAVETSVATAGHVSSQENRQNKKFIATGLIEAISDVALGGVQGGFFFAPDTVLLLSASSGIQKRNTDYLDWTNEINENRATHAGISVQQFLSNSFYVKGGVAYRYVDIRRSYATTVWGFGSPTDPRSSYEFTGESTSATISVGNQWQWSYFTLGADWITIWAPVSSNIKSEKYSYAGSTTATTVNNDADDAQKKYLKSPSVSASFYIGASF